ncbi:glycoside hydrolase family 31 protein [Haloferax volcanii]|uniref:glycoside hydrolase family 31 protein n=1 Tax=Haloferax volcanii TaxID=2246 RepID=UPI00385CF9BF
MFDDNSNDSGFLPVGRRKVLKSAAALLAGSALTSTPASAHHYDSKIHYEPQVDEDKLMQLSVEGHEVLDDGVKLDLGSHEGYIRLFSDSLARVAIVDPDEEEYESRGIKNGRDDWDTPDFSVEAGSETIAIETDTITVEINTELFGVRFLDEDGNVVNEDYLDNGSSGYVPSPERDGTASDSTIRATSSYVSDENETDSESESSGYASSPQNDVEMTDPTPNEPLPYVYKKADEDEAFYGFGEQPELTLNQRGKKLENWNTDQYGYFYTSDYVYASIPFFVGLKDAGAYGIFFDNPHHTVFHTPKVADADGVEETYDTDAGEDYYYFVGDGGQLTYYFAYGPEIGDVLDSYTSLTGTINLPPKWAMGFHQSKWEYSPDELVEVPHRYREEGIPLDAMHFDIGYMDNYRVFSIQDSHRDALQSLSEELPELKTVAVNDPGVAVDEEVDVDGDGELEPYDPYLEGTANDYWTKDATGETFKASVWPDVTVWPDFSRSEVRSWWAEQHDVLFDAGFDGVKNDMGEPAVFQNNGSYDWTMPVDNIHGTGDDTMLHEEYHNMYGFDYARAARESFDLFKPDDRPFLLNRNLYAGGQRYAAIWTGDCVSIWPHLQMQIPMMMNMGLSGLAFCGHDVGGFAGRPSPELFKRWMEVGAFIPYFRNHTDTHEKQDPDLPRNQHPWTFGEEAVDITKKYTELRYKLLPYLYNEFRDSSESGKPIFQPLVYQFQDDDEVRDIADQFLFGDDMLLAPVVEAGAAERDVYLPDGETWVDFWTNEAYDGGQWMTVDAPIDHLPIYVRTDSVIPMREVQQYTGEKPLTTLRLNTYLDEAASYSFYEDDGTTNGFEDGEYNVTDFTVTETEGGVVTFDSQATVRNYDDSQLSSYLLRLNRSKAPRKVQAGPTKYDEVTADTVEETPNSFAYSEDEGAVLVHIPADEEHSVKLYFNGNSRGRRQQ